MSQEDVNQKTNADGFISALQSASVSNYLGDQAVVDRLVRDFAGAVIGRFELVADGRLTPNEAAEADQALCVSMAKIFMGFEPGYAAVQGWNGAGLADYIKANFKATIQPEGPASVIAQSFALLAHVIYDQFRANAAEEDMANEISEGIHSLTRVLLGVYVHAD